MLCKGVRSHKCKFQFDSDTVDEWNMTVEQGWNGNDRRNPKHSEINLNQCHFPKHKSRNSLVWDRTREFAVRCRRLTVWTVVLLLTIHDSPPTPFWAPVRGQLHVRANKLTGDVVIIASWLRPSPSVRIEIHVAVRFSEAERATACVDVVHYDCVVRVQASVRFCVTKHWVRWIQTCEQNFAYVRE